MTSLVMGEHGAALVCQRDPPERGDGWRLCTGTPQPEMHFPNLTQGRLAGYDTGILFTEKEENVCFMCDTF